MPKRVDHPNSPYLWGFAAAAGYIGVSRKTLWRLRNSAERTEEEKKLLEPRILNGLAAFSKANLDRFMSPALNAPGAKPHDPFPHE